MNLLPRQPLIDFDSFLSPHFWGPQQWGVEKDQATSFAPRIDVKEKKDAYEIMAELPGVDKKDVSVSLENGILRIEAESSQEDKEEKEGRIIRQERRYGKFIRSFDLGPGIAESDIQAQFKNGVLTLDLPKPKIVEKEAKKIAIK